MTTMRTRCLQTQWPWATYLRRLRARPLAVLALLLVVGIFSLQALLAMHTSPIYTR